MVPMSDMKLAELLTSDAVTISNVSDSSAVLNELAESLAGSYDNENVSKELILSALESREKIGSTGFGNGIAIPHCKLPELDHFAVAVTVVKDGVGFGAIDKKPVQIFVAIAGPEQERNGHLHLLSKLSRILNEKSVRKEILAATGAAAVEEIILKESPDSLSTDSEEFVLMQVTVQKEEVFEALVEVMAGINNSSISVFSCDDSSHYLGTVPLFKGFFADDSSFNKMISAVIPKNLSNECVRQIELITGPLKDQTGILLTIQNLMYCSGGLNY